MPYTEACVLETLRISSVVPLSLFHRATEDVVVGGVLIPKDTTVISNLYGVHHDPTIWGKNVEDFVPERFLSPN
jgi:cytochrome P450 family 2 subfamily U polypeptide 1